MENSSKKYKYIKLLVVFICISAIANPCLAIHHCKPIKKPKIDRKIHKSKNEHKKKEDKPKTPSWPVSGIYMTKDDKKLGPIASSRWFNEIRYRGWVDGYIIHNFNNPYPDVVNANQFLSVIKGDDITIEGRTFDVHSNRPTLSLAEMEFEKIPDLCEIGFKLDIALGDTQDVLADTIAGIFELPPPAHAAANNVKDLRYIQHGSISYLTPIGKGLRLDFGKFVTHVGSETIESVKNWNYSRSYYYTYGQPFQDTGLRLNYAWNEKFYTELYIVNGWNSVFVDNNAAKTFGPSIGWNISSKVLLILNYLTGPEQNHNNSNKRRLFDAQLTLGPFCDRWTFMFNYGNGFEKNAINNYTEDARWDAFVGYLRYKINEVHEPSIRIEFYNDPNGFTTNVPQHLTEYTFTWNIKLITCSKSYLVLVRPELRYDHSSANFFSSNDIFRAKSEQWTLGMGVSIIM